PGGQERPRKAGRPHLRRGQAGRERRGPRQGAVRDGRRPDREAQRPQRADAAPARSRREGRDQPTKDGLRLSVAADNAPLWRVLEVLVIAAPASVTNIEQ